MNLKIAAKLPLAIVGLAVIVMASVVFTVSHEVEKQVVSQVSEKLTSLGEVRATALQDYLASIQSDLKFVADNHQAINAVQEFTDAWNQLTGNPESYLQDHYIEKNPNPLGEKHKLDYANDGSLYSDVHKKHHPWFRTFLEERGYYDIFLFDLKGNLVYSVFKELDYATDLNRGKYKDTGLGNAFRAAAKSSENALSFFDFKPYSPSHGAPASFMSTPIFDGNKRVGVLVYQMPIDKINGVMAQYAGLGESGETYIVGSDKLMRSQSRFSEEQTILKQRVDGVTVDSGLAGKTGTEVVADYRGVNVFSSYRPLDFMGVRWAIMAEIDEEEALRPLESLQMQKFIIAIIGFILSVFIGIIVARRVTVPMNQMTTSMQALADGNLETEVPGSSRTDELGSMAAAVQVFKDNALEQEKLREQNKHDRENAEAEKKQAMDQLANRFEERVQGIISSLTSASRQLAQNAEQMSGTIDNARELATNASSSAEQTSATVQSVASAANEMSASVQEISSQTGRSNQLVNDSVDRVAQANQQAAALGESSQKVREVVQIISDIAGQINLLALNATIESARAGEAGKGFAVVAGEVKNLASQTDQSIQEIEKVIGEMTSVSDGISDSLVSVGESVGKISEASGGISAAVEEQSATTNDIAQSMQNAAQGTSSISQNLQEVHSASSQASTASQEMISASQELSQQAETLDQQVQAFLDEIRTS